MSLFAAGNILMRTPTRHTRAQLHQEVFPGLNPLLKLGSQVFSSKLTYPLPSLSKDEPEGMSTSNQ